MILGAWLFWGVVGGIGVFLSVVQIRGWVTRKERPYSIFLLIWQTIISIGISTAFVTYGYRMVNKLISYL